ncbi:hypothetical protein, partial [Burkholderia cenocepacia]|uniref:hypothetical protein n=2 Tax=Burkholderia cenocepacia TaxID=95486 RepID=UPI001ABB10EE
MEDWVEVAGFGGREAVDVALAPLRRTLFWRTNAKTPAFRAGVLGLGSLTITYFHTGIRTIIGVESFHGPVRDG